MARSAVASSPTIGSDDHRPPVRSIIAQVVVLPNVMSYDGWHHQSSQLVVRPRKTYLRPLTIWKPSLKVLKITIDLAVSDITIAITHDFCYQSCVRFYDFPTIPSFSVSVRP